MHLPRVAGNVRPLWTVFGTYVKRGKANAAKPFKGKKLKSGTVVEVRLTKAGAIAKVVSYKVLKGKKIPVGVVRCLLPGATKPTRC